MSAILEFVPRCSRHSKSMGEGPQCFSKCREEVEAALASKPVTVEQVMPTDKVIRRESRVSHDTKPPVSHADPATVAPPNATHGSLPKKDPTAAVRRARWRKKNPEQHRVQQRAARARRKAGKAAGS